MTRQFLTSSLLLLLATPSASAGGYTYTSSKASTTQYMTQKTASKLITRTHATHEIAFEDLLASGLNLGAMGTITSDLMGTDSSIGKDPLSSALDFVGLPRSTNELAMHDVDDHLGCQTEIHSALYGDGEREDGSEVYFTVYLKSDGTYETEIEVDHADGSQSSESTSGTWSHNDDGEHVFDEDSEEDESEDEDEDDSSDNPDADDSDSNSDEKTSDATTSDKKATTTKLPNPDDTSGSPTGEQKETLMEQFAQAADKDGLITDPDYDGTGDTSAVLLPIAKTVLDLYILKDEEENSTATPPDDIFNEYVTPPKSNPFSSYRSLSLNCATEVLSITTVK